MPWVKERRTKHQARKVCAWCGIDMGPSLALEDSHGICPECAAKFLKEARQGKEEKQHRQGR